MTLLNVAPAVVVDGVEKSFGRTRALTGASLTAGAGVTGLLGPNGAGKTTLLRMLATVLAPDAGRLRLLGRDPADAGERLQIRRRLGYLPQEPGYHRGFTAFEFVDYVAILKEMTDRRARHDEVRRVLDLVGLSAVSGKKIRALSGGMRRRVGLAQALLGEPELVVLDEPTVGLDPEQRMRFREIISRIGEGRCVILSTHQTEDVAALCGHVAVVHAGTTLFTGTPAELVALADGRVWLDTVRSPTARLAWRTGTGQHRNIGDVPPPGAEVVPPSIEDAYLLLLGDESVAVPA
ncbi:MAG: ABC transporter ATP-binding protein [Actinomycetota bacterium]|nr:ABC transporter ATP-binding protein [Actinomycetota bacterium]